MLFFCCFVWENTIFTIASPGIDPGRKTFAQFFPETGDKPVQISVFPHPGALSRNEKTVPGPVRVRGFSKSGELFCLFFSIGVQRAIRPLYIDAILLTVLNIF